MTILAQTGLPRQPRRSLLNLSAGYLGLQITFGIESASLSRVFQGFGASVEDLALLWLAGPVSGLLVQPLIGRLSDRTWTAFGRRRPYMLVSGIVAVLALVQIAYASDLATAIAMVWLLEIAMNALNAPYRALVGDTLPANQQGEGFAMQTVFIGLGALTGAIMPKLLSMAGLSNVVEAGATASSIRIAFLAAALCLAISVGGTILAVREYSRADYARFGFDVIVPPARKQPSSQRMGALIRAGWVYRRIAAIQFFAWAALYLFWVYATPVVTVRAFGALSPFDARYGEGADWVGVMFATYNGIAGLSAFVLPRLFERFGVRQVHAAALLIGAMGFGGVAQFTSPLSLLFCAGLIGIAYSSMLSAPFVMASKIARQYAAGSSIGVMNMFIVAPQLAMGLCMGIIMRHLFPDTPGMALLLAGAFCGIAAALSAVGSNRATG